MLSNETEFVGELLMDLGKNGVGELELPARWGRAVRLGTFPDQRARHKGNLVWAQKAELRTVPA